MKSSKNDTFVYRTWFKTLVVYFVMFVMSAVVPITAMFPNLGYPCYFNALVDYGALNLTNYNLAHHLTPTLYLEPPEMFVYITLVFIADCVAFIYYACGEVALIKARKKVSGLTDLSAWVSAVGSPTVLFLAILKLWSIQVFIQVLSYKHVFLSAFVYFLHFLASVLHACACVTRFSPVWVVKAQDNSIPQDTFLWWVVFYLKPIVTNLYLGCLALETLVFSLSVFLALGNSFYFMVGDMVLGAVNLFLVLPIFWYILTEVWLASFLRHNFGFYCGMFIASIILILPLVRYEAVFVSAKLHTTVAINVAIIPILCSVAMLIRICRIFKSMRQGTDYVPVSETVELELESEPRPRPSRTPSPGRNRRRSSTSSSSSRSTRRQRPVSTQALISSVLPMTTDSEEEIFP
ncbi:UNVERIFIED_ASMBLY: envelope glycoprotein M [human gammaherpesvirus 4]|uniref:Envelope glycoprotein M n=2 Tax=Epstein-Barr virus (strain GD1) TaxID=10376 RepID=GM_EBVA8|nr:BBRF3 [Human herpesvirus 4 type 2]Q1HVE9.1 RecName: Full=Envelope glycoprotein M; Short=gM [Epstein-barr virus strain ag876]ABB89259.1 BBRF3 [human gammaherpesvirus 4]ALS46724.1 BBRF3 [human gammaherpesvirus 4]ALV82842.1 BBRF3 [human gammaherpesvirus 4]ALV82910.1 BBRF3 [human gammaherpesvirus 4]ALV83115.1 BBRF3 [human gammaherpesvirus 4]